MNLLDQSLLCGGPTISTFLLTTVFSILFGLIIALMYSIQNKRSKTMAIALAVMPAIVQAIIMLVSGNIGAGVAVAGAFNLVRFRSAPGNAKDIGYIFFAMVVGFMAGMGFLLFAFIFMVVIGVTLFVVARLAMDKADVHSLRIILPEDLDFNDLFDEVFAKYATNVVLNRVKTTNMGSLFELYYTLEVNNPSQIKEFIDELRVRNSNLNVVLSRTMEDAEEL